MLVKTLARAELLVRRDATLGTVMTSLARLHGNRPLAEEPSGGIRVTYRQADKRICRWSGGIRRRVDVGDRVLIHTDHSY